MVEAVMEDCFAYNRGKCKCLNVRKCMGFNCCGFYKGKSVNDAELIKYNGTTNVVEIMARYTEGHQGIYMGTTDKAYDKCHLTHDVDKDIIQMWNKNKNQSEIAKAIGWDVVKVKNRLDWLKSHGYIVKKSAVTYAEVGCCNG